MTPELVSSVSASVPIFGPILAVLFVAIGVLGLWLRDVYAGRIADAKEYAAATRKLAEDQIHATSAATAAVNALQQEIEDLSMTRRKPR